VVGDEVAGEGAVVGDDLLAGMSDQVAGRLERVDGSAEGLGPEPVIGVVVGDVDPGDGLAEGSRELGCFRGVREPVLSVHDQYLGGQLD